MLEKAQKWAVPLVPACLFCAVVCLYWPTLGYQFVYDDIPRIIVEPLVRGPNQQPLQSVAQIVLSPTYPGDLYRPMATLSYRWNVWGPNPVPADFHLVNGLLHALNSVLVRGLFLKAGLSPYVATMAALLFAVHPIQVESVANISGRPELLALLFGLLATFAFDRMLRAATLRAGLAWISVAALGLLLALLSKESAFSFLLLIPLFLLRTAPNVSKRLPLVALTALTPAACALLLRHLALGAAAFPSRVELCLAENPLNYNGLSISQQIFAACVVLGRYLRHLFLPVQLSADYSLACPQFFASIFSVEALAAFSLLIFWVVWSWRWRKLPAGLFGFWFLLAFSFTANLLFPTGTVMADRLAYAPALGFCGALACSIGTLGLPRLLKTPVVIALAVVWALLGMQRQPLWKNHENLFLGTLADAPLSPKAWENAGIVAYREQKDRDLAVRYFNQALSLDPLRLDAMRFLADIYAEQGQLRRAESWCQKILQLDPEDRPAHAALATLHQHLSQTQTGPGH